MSYGHLVPRYAGPFEYREGLDHHESASPLSWPIGLLVMRHLGLPGLQQASSTPVQSASWSLASPFKGALNRRTPRHRRDPPPCLPHAHRLQWQSRVLRLSSQSPSRSNIITMAAIYPEVFPHRPSSYYHSNRTISPRSHLTKVSLLHTSRCMRLDIASP